MALASNVFDLLGEGEDSSHAGSFLSIVDDVEAKAAFEAAERKRREEAKEAARKRKDAEKKLKEAARKKKEKEEEAARKRKEQEERASMARRLENRRRWFESQEQKKRQLEEEKRQWEEQQRRLEERKKMEEEDEKLRKENPEKWEEENKRREKESIKAAVLGLLRPRRSSGSPSSPLEFQRRGSPGYKQGQVRGAKTKQVPRSPSTLSDPSDIVSLSSYSGSTSTRPSTSDQTQGSQRSATENTSAKPAAMAASLSSMSNGSNCRSRRAEAIKIRPAVILASSSSVLPTSTGPRLREAAKINGPAVKAETAGLVKKEESADTGSDIAVVPTSTTNPSSSSDQVQESERKEAKDNGTDGEGWQLVASRRRRKQGSDRSSNPDQNQTYCVDNKELEKDKSRGAAAVVVENGIADGGHVNMNGNKDSTAVDGDSAAMSSDGRSRRNKNGSLRRKLKKKNAEGEKKAAEDTNQEADTSSVQNQSTPRLYTMKEYEEMKKRESLIEKKDNDNNSSRQQFNKVTIDVNKEFRTPQVDKKQRCLDNGGRRYNNEGQRFNNGEPRYNYGERRLNKGGRKYDNRGQRFNNEGRELQFSFDNVDEFPTLGRRKEILTTSTKLV